MVSSRIVLVCLALTVAAVALIAGTAVVGATPLPRKAPDDQDVTIDERKAAEPPGKADADTTTAADDDEAPPRLRRKPDTSTTGQPHTTTATPAKEAHKSDNAAGTPGIATKSDRPVIINQFPSRPPPNYSAFNGLGQMLPALMLMYGTQKFTDANMNMIQNIGRNPVPTTTNPTQPIVQNNLANIVTGAAPGAVIPNAMAPTWPVGWNPSWGWNPAWGTWNPAWGTWNPAWGAPTWWF